MKHLGLLFVMLGLQLQAQQLGVFSESHVFNDAPFNGLTRNVAFSVPTNYNPTQTYPLIFGLHACGSNENIFRDALSTLADSLNAIVVCPNSGTTSFSDEYGGREMEILDILYDRLVIRYAINPLEIYLTGFSCNGREAIPIVLEEKTNVPFAGVIAYAPAINSTNISGSFFYRTQVTPICLCMGNNDFFYTQQPFYSFYIDSLNARSAVYKENIMPGVGHTTAHPRFTEFMLDCFDFISRQSTIGIEENSIQEHFYTLTKGPSSTLELTSSSNQKLKYSLFSIDGKLIEQGELESGQKAVLTADKSGVYFLGLSDSGGARAVEKIWLERF